MSKTYDCGGPKGGTQDAHALLLLRYKAEDDRWVVEYIVDIKKRLTRLFWMSPRQRERAADLAYVLIHDNTYLTNQLGMSLAYSQRLIGMLLYADLCTCMQHRHISNRMTYTWVNSRRRN